MVARGETDTPVEELNRELERLARSFVARRRGDAIDSGDLVQETHLRLLARSPGSWNGRAHLFGSAARAMREVLADRERRLARARHAGERCQQRAEDVILPVAPKTEDLVALHEALARLGAVDRRKADVVRLRFLVGFTERQTAEVLGVSTRTVERDWLACRPMLRAALSQGQGKVFGRSLPALSRPREHSTAVPV